jgi:hypothetical protein
LRGAPSLSGARSLRGFVDFRCFCVFLFCLIAGAVAFVSNVSFPFALRKRLFWRLFLWLFLSICCALHTRALAPHMACGRSAQRTGRRLLPAESGTRAVTRGPSQRSASSLFAVLLICCLFVVCSLCVLCEFCAFCADSAVLWCAEFCVRFCVLRLFVDLLCFWSGAVAGAAAFAFGVCVGRRPRC